MSQKISIGRVSDSTRRSMPDRNPGHLANNISGLQHQPAAGAARSARRRLRRGTGRWLRSAAARRERR